MQSGRPVYEPFNPTESCFNNNIALIHNSFSLYYSYSTYALRIFYSYSNHSQLITNIPYAEKQVYYYYLLFYFKFLVNNVYYSQ